MRLRVLRRDAHRVAGMMLGFGQVALAQQDQRQLVGGDEVVGVQRDDAADQRLGGARVALRLADVVQDRQRAGPIGCEFQHIQAEPFGGFVGALAVRLDGALDQRNEMAGGLGRRQRLSCRLQQRTARRPLPQGHNCETEAGAFIGLQ